MRLPLTLGEVSPQRQNPTSSRAAPSLHARAARRLALLCRGGDVPDPPKLKVLVPSTRANQISIGADTTEQHSAVVSVSNFRYLLKGRVCVNHEAVGGVSVGSEELFLVRRPLDRCDLGRSLKGV